MITLDRIMAQQEAKNEQFMEWLENLNAKFLEMGHDPTIEPYQFDRNKSFPVQPIVATVTYPIIGKGAFYLNLRHAQTWKDLKASVDTILYRIKVT